MSFEVGKEAGLERKRKRRVCERRAGALGMGALHPGVRVTPAPGSFKGEPEAV